MSDIDDIRERKMEELRAEESESTAGRESPSEPFHVTGQEELSEATASNDVVLADFYADWCGPCQMLEPTVETLAAETTAAVAKVDVDENQELAAEYGVRGVPTMVLFADGEPVERVVGVQEESSLANLIRRHS
jgi:thioredoxin 1